MRKIVLALILLLTLSGCSKSYMAEREFYKATKILDAITPDRVKASGNTIFDPAIAAFQQVAQKYPGTRKALDSLFEISNLYMYQKKFDQAREALDKIIVNYPDNKSEVAEARFRIADIYDRQDEWGKAERAYWETAEYHPLELRGLQAPIQVIGHYGKLRYTDAQRRAYEQARSHYKKALVQVGPIQASAPVRNYMAIADSVMGDWKSARKEWISIANDFRDHPSAPSFYVAAAEASMKLNQPAAALTLYKIFLERASKNRLVPAINVRAGLIEQRLGHYETARKYYRTAIAGFGEKSPSTADAKLLIARSYQDEGNWNEAEKIYREVQASFPRSSAALQIPIMYGRYYKKQGNEEKLKQVLDEAVKNYEEIIKKHPGTTIAQYASRLINDAYEIQGNWTPILSHIDAAMNNSSSPEEKGKLLLMKAVIVETRVKDNALAMELYNSFLKDYPNHPMVKVAKDHQARLSQITDKAKVS